MRYGCWMTTAAGPLSRSNQPPILWFQLPASQTLFYCLPWRHNIFYPGILPEKSRCPPSPRRGALSMQTVQSKELHLCVHWELHNLPHWSVAVLCLQRSKFAGRKAGDWRFLTQYESRDRGRQWRRLGVYHISVRYIVQIMFILKRYELKMKLGPRSNGTTYI